MKKNVLKILFFCFFNTLFLTSCIYLPVGGTCEYNDEIKLARVSQHYNNTVILNLSDGNDIKLSTKEFKRLAQFNDHEYPQVNNYFEIITRHHTSGGCTPFSIQSITKLDIPNTMLSPSSFLIYKGSFILAETKSCMLSPPKSCTRHLALSPSLNENLYKLNSLKPRTLNFCDAFIMQIIWPNINKSATMEKNITRVIACAKDTNNIPVAIEFSVPNVESKDILIRKIY